MRELGDDFLECFDDPEQWQEVEDHEEVEELPAREPRPSQQISEPVPRNATATRTARTAVREPHTSNSTRENAGRLANLKSHGLAWIPWDVPPKWRAKVIEHLDHYVSKELVSVVGTAPPGR